LSKCGPGTSLALEQSKNGMYIAVGSEDGYMVVWEAYTGFMVCSHHDIADNCSSDNKQQ
jgi:predicted nucleic acid-binding Zn finger protein